MQQEKMELSYQSFGKVAKYPNLDPEKTVIFFNVIFKGENKPDTKCAAPWQKLMAILFRLSGPPMSLSLHE